MRNTYIRWILPVIVLLVVVTIFALAPFVLHASAAGLHTVAPNSYWQW